MEFYHKRKRSAPTVIIVALIDILIVLLIFLIVTTTFKQNPSVRITLPESKEAKEGVSVNSPNIIIVEIDKQAPYFRIDGLPLTLDNLKKKFQESKINGAQGIAIRADAQAPFEQIIKVLDSAKESGLTNFSAFVKKPGQK
ncbi:MAG: ExbD/TolR family protein [Verrucomicrobiia bacterium]